MELEFYRCFICKRANETRKMLNETMCKCGSRKFNPSHLTLFEMWLFLLLNPSYLVQAWKE